MAAQGTFTNSAGKGTLSGTFTPQNLSVVSGLVVSLNQVTLNGTAVPGAGNLLCAMVNLLCAVVNLLNSTDVGGLTPLTPEFRAPYSDLRRATVTRNRRARVDEHEKQAPRINRSGRRQH